MNITVNGQPQVVATNRSIAELLCELGLESRHVAVEVNMEIVSRAQHGQHRLAEGDRLEVVTLVGGG